MVADDLGVNDLGSYGATKIETPNVDRLARQGVRFTDAHSTAAVCQPTRYAILSGTYLFRARRQGQWALFFHEGQHTLPGVLKAAGYRTAAFGKWHLGFGRGSEPDYNDELKPGPLEIGFDYYFGTPRTHNEPPFVFVENHRVVAHDPGDPIRAIAPTGLGHGMSAGAARAHAARPIERIDLIVAEKAAEWLGRQPKDAPIFLYLAFVAPHLPIAPAVEFQGKSRAGNYGDYVQQLDACVALVLAALEREGRNENTLVIFTSDNGAMLHPAALRAGHRSNGAWLGQKTDAWEGGHRVPFIARWPGHIPPNSQCGALLSVSDLMATCAAAAQVPLPEGAAPDSLNQLPALTDPAQAVAIRTEMGIEGVAGFALRQGDWVYLPKQGSLGKTVQVPAGPRWGQPYAGAGFLNSDVDAHGKVRPNAPAAQLYNLETDPFQRTNVIAREPERAEGMRRRLEEILLVEPGP